MNVGTSVAWGLTLTLLGVGLTGALWYLFPLWDILEMTFVIVIVPLMLLVAFGLISSGTWQIIRSAVSVNKEALVAQLEAYHKAQSTAQASAPTAPAPTPVTAPATVNVSNNITDPVDTGLCTE